MSPADDRLLAGLLLERAKARIDAGDLAADDDVRAAKALGELAPAQLVRETALARVLHSLRRGDPAGKKRARQLIAEFHAQHGSDFRTTLLEPELSTLEELALFAAWLEAGGAKRFALEAYRAYRSRGGLEKSALDGGARLERWWGTEPPIEDLLTEALAAWLTGDSPRFITPEIKARAASAKGPAWIEPTLRRARGDVAGARVALAAIRPKFSHLALKAQALVLLEIALLRPSGAAMPLGRGALAWLVSARARRAGVSAARNSLGEASLALRAIDYRVGLEFEKLADLGDRLASTAAARLGGNDPRRIAIEFGLASPAALARIARAQRTQPVLAERLARTWIESAIAPHERAPAVIELFARAGDSARALRFAEALLSESPTHPSFLLIAAIRNATAGDTARAEVLASQAAALSGDAGRTWRIVTKRFVAVGAHLPALAAGRRALSLSAPSLEGAIREDLARAMADLNRAAEAEALLDHPSVASYGKLAALTLGENLAWNPADPFLLAQAAGREGRAGREAEAKLEALAHYSRDPVPMLVFAALLESRGQRDMAHAAREEARARAATVNPGDVTPTSAAADPLR